MLPDQVPRRVDILCEVLDNFGDAGISWRLAGLIADEWQVPVHLYIDQPALLTRWRKTAAAGLTASPEVFAFAAAASMASLPALCIVMLGTALSEPLRRRLVAAHVPRLRYEYLSAETWIDSCHGLPSLHPADGSVEWFYYPGYTQQSGGLLRERTPTHQASGALSEQSFLAQHGLTSTPDVLRVCVFGYAEAVTAVFIRALATRPEPTVIFISRGLYEAMVPALLDPPAHANCDLRVHEWLDQRGFDSLLQSCDLALVRGEDSWVRAQWTGQPFVWQAYRQEHDGHLPKVDAWLTRMLTDATPAAAAAILGLMTTLNRTEAAITDAAMALTLSQWFSAREEIKALHRRWRDTLLAQTSLTDRLAAFLRDHLQLSVSPAAPIPGAKSQPGKTLDELKSNDEDCPGTPHRKRHHDRQ